MTPDWDCLKTNTTSSALITIKLAKWSDYLEGCGALRSIQEINWTGKPQVDYMDHLPENKEVRGAKYCIPRTPKAK